MTKKKILTIALAALLLAAGIGVGAYAASNYGTQADPLVAKSYLDSTLTPKLQAQFDSEVDGQVQILESQISASQTGLNFVAVTLAAGQTLKGGSGCEIILRVGAAVGFGSEGISDMTDGTAVTGGTAVKTNHLCIVGTSGNGVKAGSSATLLVRGGYAIS